jgi:pyruvate dehydrogenase (quinone)
MLGFRGLRIDGPDQVAGAWDEALAADRPVVLEAVVDPEVPPLPPHIEFDQARQLAGALLAGDPARGTIIRRVLKTKAQDVLNR